jgi:hypothetical protein
MRHATVRAPSSCGLSETPDRRRDLRGGRCEPHGRRPPGDPSSDVDQSRRMRRPRRRESLDRGVQRGPRRPPAVGVIRPDQQVRDNPVLVERSRVPRCSAPRLSPSEKRTRKRVPPPRSTRKHGPCWRRRTSGPHGHRTPTVAPKRSACSAQRRQDDRWVLGGPRLRTARPVADWSAPDGSLSLAWVAAISDGGRVTSNLPGRAFVGGRLTWRAAAGTDRWLGRATSLD